MSVKIPPRPEARWTRRKDDRPAELLSAALSLFVEKGYAATRLDDLRIPPANRLEALKGGRKSKHSIRINDQWRICFRWSEGDAFDVEIVDYH